jgi:dipicolinate synthase subunit B
MKEFWKYFLGQGDTVEFENFSLTHLCMILSGVLVIYLIYRCRDRLAQSRHEEKLRYLLAFALICSEMSYYWRLIAIPSLGPNPIDHLPISVCGWAAIFCSYMVIGKSQTLFDISYFWLLSGSLFALLTPTVITYTGPTRFRFYQFWMEHLLGYVAIFYMIFVHKMRPTIKSAIKSYAALLVLTGIAYATNQMLNRMCKDDSYGIPRLGTIADVEAITGNNVIDTIPGAEPIGPKKLFDLIIVAPCTGNTIAKLANAITDTPVTMAVKAHLRNNRPVLLAISTNDGLTGNAANIGKLLNTRNYYFVPFRQDDCSGKPNSLVADMALVPVSASKAANGEQIQPLLR